MLPAHPDVEELLSLERMQQIAAEIKQNRQAKLTRENSEALDRQSN